MRRTIALAVSAPLLVTVFVATPTGTAHATDRSPSARLLTGRPMIIGHRGYTGTGATENTVNSYRAAYLAGADVIEMDVRFTKTDVPVIMHDSTVTRTTNGTGKVSNYTYTRFHRLVTADGVQHPPSLYQALDVAHQFHRRALVELKTVPTRKQLAALKTRFDKLDAYSYSVLQSFSGTAVLKANRSNPKYKIARLLHTGTTKSWIYKYDAECPYYTHVSKAGVAKLHKHHVKVYAWTVDDTSAMRRLAADGVDGIVTNKTPTAGVTLGL